MLNNLILIIYFLENKHPFTQTDPDWPQVMRVLPILDWTYSDVWIFFRTLSLPYCPLYDQGYTSLGNSTTDSFPNPELRSENGTYRPAYELVECSEERTGRQ